MKFIVNTLLQTLLVCSLYGSITIVGADNGFVSAQEGRELLSGSYSPPGAEVASFEAEKGFYPGGYTITSEETSYEHKGKGKKGKKAKKGKGKGKSGKGKGKKGKGKGKGKGKKGKGKGKKGKGKGKGKKGKGKGIGKNIKASKKDKVVSCYENNGKTVCRKVTGKDKKKILKEVNKKLKNGKFKGKKSSSRNGNVQSTVQSYVQEVELSPPPPSTAPADLIPGRRLMRS